VTGFPHFANFVGDDRRGRREKRGLMIGEEGEEGEEAGPNDRRGRRGSGPMIDEEGEKTRADLARVAWLVTVFICLVAVLILALQGYLGYAGVTLAVALSAGINLT
jgi:hypothetical protein